MTDTEIGIAGIVAAFPLGNSSIFTPVGVGSSPSAFSNHVGRGCVLPPVWSVNPTKKFSVSGSTRK